jgi:hypothetical protein
LWKLDLEYTDPGSCPTASSTRCWNLEFIYWEGGTSLVESRGLLDYWMCGNSVSERENALQTNLQGPIHSNAYCPERQVVSFMSWPFYLQERSSRYQRRGCWIGLRALRDSVEKIKISCRCQESNPVPWLSMYRWDIGNAEVAPIQNQIDKLNVLYCIVQKQILVT